MGVMYEVNQSTGAVGDPVLDSSTGSVGGGGLTQEEHDALMATYGVIAEMPHRGDINPERNKNYYAISGYGNDTYYTYLPVLGYDKISLKRVGSCNSCNVTFLNSEDDTISSFTVGTSWSDWQQIPSNAVFAKVAVSMNTASSGGCYYGMLTADSPYNPDNQNP